ncbi:hypothetical protein A2U01_0051991, partial [Trifolium medium]|nr:hypothetical protein [Trifolium medium]
MTTMYLIRRSSAFRLPSMSHICQFSNKSMKNSWGNPNYSKRKNWGKPKNLVSHRLVDLKREERDERDEAYGLLSYNLWKQYAHLGNDEVHDETDPARDPTILVEVLESFKCNQT